ncbi:MAG: aminopeptidase [Pseudomonadota bacterium]
MQEPAIAPEALETWATYLIEHSVGGVGPGDVVMIKGERICWPLMEILERKVIAAGAVPDVLLVPPNNERGRVWSAVMAQGADPALIAAVPEWNRARYERMNKYIEVLGAEDPRAYAGLSAERAGLLAKADRPFSALRLARTWVITLFPTPGQAAAEGLSLEDYAAFIVRASTEDPRPLQAAEERLRPLFDEAKSATVLTWHPHERRELTLRLGLEHSVSELCYGLRNFPDGEIFTSPDARSVQGEIFVDLPVSYGGTDMKGIYLKFEDGRIVAYGADEGLSQLTAIVETDEGSHRLGELALGMNPGLDRVLKHPLFVEKVGGTLHIAIGMSYEECYPTEGVAGGIEALVEQGICNRSAQHVDIVVDFRPGGCGRRVFFDDREVVVQGGIWVPAE